MNIQKNAGTPPNMRALIVGRRQAGETPRSIAGAVGVSPATVGTWLRRHESEGVVGRQDRTGRPRRLRARITSDRPGRNPAPGPPFWKIAHETGLSRPTMRIGKAKGPSRRSARDPRIEIVRYAKTLYAKTLYAKTLYAKTLYAKTLPGEMIHIAINKLGRIAAIGHRIAGDRSGQSARREN